MAVRVHTSAGRSALVRYLVGVHFDVIVTERDGWAVLSVMGELDLATAPQLRQQVVTTVNDGSNRLLLDLTATDFLDSIGLGVIVGALKRVQSTGGSLVIATDVDRIRAVFELTRLDAIIPLFRDVDAAVASAPPSGDDQSDG
ncbi:MAG: STAS domain-containing protein [Actinobacteria bacterium]|nr:STAS domain-containing protein [Actinomycetota bacterium]